MKLLYGSEVVSFIKERQAKQVRNLRQTWKVVPRLAVIQTIDDPVINTYVNLKRRYAQDILIEFEQHKINQKDAAATIKMLNEREDVSGIIIQLPLEDMSSASQLLNLVSVDKDVDGLADGSSFDPATPIAINWLLAAYGIELEGRSIGIVGAGRLVGAPLAQIWQDSGFDVAIYDEENGDLKNLKSHDVIVTATGVPGLITNDMVAHGAVVVDAGTSAEKNAIIGDLSGEVRRRQDVTITPEKGGVGPLTVAALFENVILAARKRAEVSRLKD